MTDRERIYIEELKSKVAKYEEFLNEVLEGPFKWFRELVSPIHSKIEDLVHCPYCLGHYVAIFVLIITKYRIKCTDIEIINFIFTWFAVMGCVACMHFIMTRAYEPIARAMTARKLEQLNK